MTVTARHKYYVLASEIATTLGCSVDDVNRAAERAGIAPVEHPWLKVWWPEDARRIAWELINDDLAEAAS